MLFDTHAHLNDSDFQGDFEEVLMRASEKGVKRIVNVGYDLQACYDSVELAREVDFIYAAVGIHPHDACQVGEDTYEILERLAHEKKVKAVGEIGLDYYRNLSPKEVQQKVFRRQINLAKELRLPVIIHDREAHQDTLDILREERAGEVGGIMHCFSGSWEMAKSCLDLGFDIALGGTVTFKNARRPLEIAQLVPADRLLLETDCPYLAPEPKRGRRNEPAFVAYVAAKIAEVRNVPLEELKRRTFENACRAFGLDNE